MTAPTEAARLAGEIERALIEGQAGCGTRTVVTAVRVRIAVLEQVVRFLRASPDHSTAPSSTDVATTALGVAGADAVANSVQAFINAQKSMDPDLAVAADKACREMLADQPATGHSDALKGKPVPEFEAERPLPFDADQPAISGGEWQETADVFTHYDEITDGIDRHPLGDETDFVMRLCDYEIIRQAYAEQHALIDNLQRIIAENEAAAPARPSDA